MSREVSILTNKTGMLMFHEALMKEAEKHTGQGLWQQIQSSGNKAVYKELTLEQIEKTVASFLNKKKPKRNRRKMKKHGKTI